jgi:sec-independent protein translocase protein TatA
LKGAADKTQRRLCSLCSEEKGENLLMRISTNELLIVLLIVLVIFGPKQLPKLGKMFGKTMKGFKEGVTDDEDEAKTEDTAPVAAEEKKPEDKAE